MYHEYPSGGNFSLSEVNALREEEFEWLFDDVIENSQTIAKWVAKKRPFKTVIELKQCFHEYLLNLDAFEKRNVVLKYPDFLGKVISQQSTSSTATSTRREPKFEPMTREQEIILEEYNDSYKLKFSMPFIMCLEETNDVEIIFTAMEERLPHSASQELDVIIQEICKICDKRVDTLIWPDV